MWVLEIRVLSKDTKSVGLKRRPDSVAWTEGDVATDTAPQRTCFSGLFGGRRKEGSPVSTRNSQKIKVLFTLFFRFFPDS